MLCIYFPVYAQDNAPEWFLKLPDGKNIVAYYAGLGSATNIKVARELALINALTDLGDSLDSRMSSLTTEFIDEVEGESITIAQEEVVKKVVTDLSIGGFKIVQAEEHPCGYEMFCSYVLIEYPLSPDINQENKSNNTNTRTENTDNTVPSWYLVPRAFDERYYYFSGFGSNPEKNKAINIAVIDSFKLQQTAYKGRMSSLVSEELYKTDTSITKDLEGKVKIVSENFITELFYQVKSDQEEFELCNKDTSFQEDYEISENVFLYFFDYTCESKDFYQNISIAGKIPQKTLIHYRWGGLDKIKVYQQTNGDYAAYVLIKLAVIQSDYETRIKKEQAIEQELTKEQEIEQELRRSEAFKALEEEMNKTEESNDNN